ncbi:MAG: hypothetical protein ACFFCV_11530 [Promethearchaeota archaeon]
MPVKDTVTLKTRGESSIGFTISKNVRKQLKLKFGDIVQIKIYHIIKGKNEGELENINFPAQIIKVSTTTMGVTVKKDIISQFELEADDIIGVEINIEK